MTIPVSTVDNPKRGAPLPLHSHPTKLSIAIFISLLFLLLKFETLNYSLSPSWLLFLHKPSPSTAAAELNRTRADLLRGLTTFLPLKDVTRAGNYYAGNTWFMSSLNDSLDGDDSLHLHFPSPASKGRLLCLSARDLTDGAKNSYALAWREALPPGATLLPDLTFISDTYYDYRNLWHGISALLPFTSWHERNHCVKPARWVLFHRGELRTRMGGWVKALAEAAIGEVKIEDLRGYGRGPACFEEALVFRREGALGKARRREVYGLMRCKARAHCGVARARDVDRGREAVVRMTLLLRLGSRSFKNESGVIQIFERECKKVRLCRAKVAWANNMTFCDQVKLMSETDVLISPHGAQMANLFLMDKKSSIMELYPKGWKEFAGGGQFVFRWMADWAGMQHKGSWWDPEGDECGETDKLKCFLFYKDKQIGQDEAYFGRWAAKVIADARQLKSTSVESDSKLTPCSCTEGRNQDVVLAV